MKRMRLFTTTLILLAGMRLAAAAPPPAPWVIHPIGPQETPGAASLDFRGLWTLRAHNGDILQSADSAYYVCQALAGNGSVVALLLAQEGGHASLARSGVMLREENSEGARNVFLGMTGIGLGLTMRLVTNAPTQNEGAGSPYSGRQFPLWIRLQRQGDEVTPFLSSDGYGWTQLHTPVSLPGLRQQIYAGLAATSVFGGPMTAVFNNPTVAPGQVSPLVRTSVGDSAVLLDWSPVAGAAGYVVRRSAPETPGFAADLLTPQPITATSFVDSRLANGRPYRYLVSPLFQKEGEEAEEGWSTAVTVTPLTNPLGLMGTDIDVEVPRLAGAITFDPTTGLYRATGSGSGIWDTADHCFFASKLVEGDFQVTARLTEKPNRKAGVMIRESLDASGRIVLLAGTADRGITYQWRDKIDGATAWPGEPAVSARDFTGTAFLRLVRKGATVTPFTSMDGTTYAQAGPPRTFDPPLAPGLHVGYAVSSESAVRPGTSTFSDLQIE
jgi:hypothetical protein